MYWIVHEAIVAAIVAAIGRGDDRRDRRGDDLRDRLLVYSVQAIGHRGYANEHQSHSHSITFGGDIIIIHVIMYCIITLLLRSHCFR